MKQFVLLLAFNAIVLTVFSGFGIATYDKATFGVSTSLWKDNNSSSWIESSDNEYRILESNVYRSEPYDLINQPGSMSSDDPKNIDQSGNSFVWVSFICSIIIFFFVCKWAYLAIMLTDYEKFTLDMRDYYYHYFGGGQKSWPEGYHFPYDEINAVDYLFNFRVWSVRQALDAFAYFDYQQWCENKDWRPHITKK